MFAKDPGRKEFPVLPLDDIVVFPQTRTKLKVDKETGQQLAAALQAGGPATAVALAVREGCEPTEENLYFGSGSLAVVRRTTGLLPFRLATYRCSLCRLTASI